MLKIQEPPKLHDLIKLVPGSVIGACMLLFLAQMARSYGKAIEQTLIQQWGGLPTTIMLRHRDNSIDPITKKRYHEALSHIVPNSILSTENDEQTNPQHTDNIYSSWTKYLIAQTRDQNQFPLLINENIDYGFRRNLLGLKPLGYSLFSCWDYGM